MPTLDVTPLLRKPSAAEAADLKRRASLGEFGAASLLDALPYTAAAGLGGIGLMLAWFVASVFVMAPASPARDVTLTTGPFIGFAVVSVVLMGAAALLVVRLLLKRDRWMRLACFARANGRAFYRRTPDPAYPAAFFNRGDNRFAIDHVVSPTGPFADAGTFSYDIGGSDHNNIRNAAYAAFRLPRPLPHLILARHGAEPRLTVSANQRLTLGEPFDSHFSLYAPAGYGADAFRLLPPDLMEDLIALPSVWSVEIIDSWVFLECHDALDFADPAMWQSLEHIEQTTIDRLCRLAVSYADDRADAATPTASYAVAPFEAGRRGLLVAQPGRRLRPNRTVAVVAAVAFVAAWVALAVFLVMFGHVHRF